MVGPELIATEKLRPLRRTEYDRLVELGAFEGERIELLYGALVAREPQYAAHASTVRRLYRLFTEALGDRAEVFCQMPIALTDESEPEPDIALVPPGDYRAEHPRTALLIVEVADSSLARDRRIKARLYAEAGVREYWIVNLPEQSVEVHREPEGGAYRTATRHVHGETLRPLAFPDVALRVDEIIF